MLAYINKAIAVETAGLGLAPAKKELVMPQYFRKQLDASEALKIAFGAFTLTGKKSLQNVAEAKQDKTKLARFEKIKPLILAGKGLNDKYR